MNEDPGGFMPLTDYLVGGLLGGLIYILPFLILL